MKKNPTIAVVGLGYVGLPLAAAFAEKYSVIGFDINAKRVKQLREGKDVTLELPDEDLQRVLNYEGDKGLSVTEDVADIKDAEVYIVTVPTPKIGRASCRERGYRSAVDLPFRR